MNSDVFQQRCIIYDTYTVPVVERSTTNEFKDVLPKSECSEKKYSTRVHKACEELKRTFNKLAYNPEESFKLKMELVAEIAIKYGINFVSLRRIILAE